MAAKGKKGDKDQFINIPYQMLRSDAWRSLSGAAVKLYLELHTRFNGGNNGKLHLSMNEATELLGIGKATAKRAYDELMEKGFLVLETPGNWYSRRAHDWRITSKPTETRAGRIPPTVDWKDWRKPTAAKQMQGSKTEPSPGRTVPYENQPKPFGSAPVPVTPVFGRR
jgi:hypothetical protein